MRRSTAGSPVLLSLGVALVVTAGALVPGLTPDATQADEVKEWKNISLLYLSDIKGKIEPCG